MENSTTTKPFILFVYNAESGIFNTVTDIAHKIFSPETYTCNLCSLTYGTFTIRKEWQLYLEELEADFEFLHKDELSEKYDITPIELPAVFLKQNSKLGLWITAEEINRCQSVDDLKALISRRLIALKNGNMMGV